MMNESIASFYNRIYRFYPCIDFFLSGQKRRLVQLVNSQPRGRLLDVGLGNGSLLRSYGAHRIWGIDLSENMLQVARKKKGGGEADLRLMNGEDLQFADGHFDYVVMNHVLSVTGDPNRMINEAYRVLQPGGLLFILNHFTPSGPLRFLDAAFAPFSSFFRFRSRFHLSDLPALQPFQCVHSLPAGTIGYYRILVYRK